MVIGQKRKSEKTVEQLLSVITQTIINLGHIPIRTITPSFGIILLGFLIHSRQSTILEKFLNLRNTEVLQVWIKQLSHLIQ